MKRRDDKNPRSHTSVRFNDDEKEIVEQKAQEYGFKKKSAYLREVALNPEGLVASKRSSSEFNSANMKMLTGEKRLRSKLKKILAPIYEDLKSQGYVLIDDTEDRIELKGQGYALIFQKTP